MRPQLGGYKQLEKFEIKREIESFQLLKATAANSSSQKLLIRCTSGEIFRVATLSEQQKKRTVQSWKGPVHDDDVAYIVDGVQNPSSDDGQPQIALASVAGKITLFSSAHEKQWTMKVGLLKRRTCTSTRVSTCATAYLPVHLLHPLSCSSLKRWLLWIS